MVRISVDLPEDVAEALGRAAADRQSTSEAMLADLAQRLIADEAALLATLAQSEAEMAAGLDVPHEEVMAEMRSWAADLRARQAPR
jgi:predicted transcriptional regulator